VYDIATQVAVWWWISPDPQVGAAVALRGRDPHRIGDVIGAGQGCAGAGFRQVFNAG
jgi:hypothetical protein